MNNKDIILFSLQSWDMDIGGNFKDIAKVMAKQNRVIYVNRPLDWITRIKTNKDAKTKTRLSAIRKLEKPLVKVEENLWVLNIRKMLLSINFLPKGPLYNFLNKRNSKIVADEIKYAMKELGFENEIVIVDNDFFNGLYLKEFLDPPVFVYYLRDYLRFHKYFQRHGAAAEPSIIQKADAVITDSLYLDDYARKFNSRSYFIPKGCGEEFRRLDYAEPGDLQTIPSPRVGYLGAITSKRLDLTMLESIAERLPHFNFVYVGPEDEGFRNSVLHRQPNVYFLGFKEQSLAPSYIQYFDICTNVQVINETTIGNHPRKIIEYLSAGKPVIATKTKAMLEYDDIIFLCESEECYVNSIEKAYSEIDNKEKRKLRLTRGHEYTWDNTVNKFYDVIKNIYAK